MNPTLIQSTVALKQQYYERALALLRDTDATFPAISAETGISLHSVRKIAATHSIKRPLGRPRKVVTNA